MIKKLKIMKSTKFIITTLFFLATLGINAQLKVRTDGSIQTGYNGYANFMFGHSGYVETNGDINGQWGIEVCGTSLNIWKPWPSSSAGNYKLWISENGNVGIGLVPSSKLDVAGSIAIYGDIKLSSDERLKKDIVPLADQAVNIYKLNAKSYKKHLPEEELLMPVIKDANGAIRPEKNFPKTKKAQKESTEYGFLAQELKDVYPDLVSLDSAGYYLVNYIGLIPILVEALKDQKTQIDVLSTLVNKQNSAPQKVGATSTPIETNTLTYPVLEQNVPNPFNANTTIGFYLPNTVNTAGIYVYDMNGTQLKSYTITEKGKGNISIKGLEFSAGMYLYALIVDGKVIDTKRMILTK